MNLGGATRHWIGMTSLALLLSVQGGCGFGPYKIEVQQGNVVTQEMLSKLRLDMTRSQVKFVLGTPLVVSVFRPDRWDYYYLAGRAGKPGDRRQITLVFEADKLARVTGDVAGIPGLPVEPSAAAPAASK